MMALRWALCALGLGTAPLSAAVFLTEAEIQQTLAFGPWPPAAIRDPSNRVSGDPAAIALGEALFFDPVLSVDGTMSCATCHDPSQSFAEAKPRSMGRVLLDRNTPSLWNVATHRWFGWAGDTDTLWAQSLTPILNPAEMGHSVETLAQALVQSVHLAAYRDLFGDPAEHAPLDLAVNLAKALAAYQETLISPATPFDAFREALADGDGTAAAQYPEAAQRGLSLFLGEGRCVFCHSGPTFTNGEFHDAGVPYFLEAGRVDPGRHDGIAALLASPLTLDGAFSDDPDRSGAWAVRGVRMLHGNFGVFRVPGLRGVAETAPYMHDGSLADLEAVLEHYNSIDMERLHADGEAILRPLRFDAAQLADLRAFLESLSVPTLVRE